MALVNEGYLHYREMKKFLKILLLRHVWSDFEMISQKGSLDDPFQNMFAKLLFVKKHGSGDRGYLHHTDMKKLLKNQTAGQISK